MEVAMARRNKSRIVVIEGTVISATWDDDWASVGVTIVTPESEAYDEYYVEPDEVGRELADHLYEFVRVYGVLHEGGSTRSVVRARMAVKVLSDVGRTEYVLVGLAHCEPAESGQVALAAYPMGKGSGSVTTFSRADGFVTLGRHVELAEQGQSVQVRLLGRDLAVADLVVIGSHCVGLDLLLGELQESGFRGKLLAVGSTAGLAASLR